MSPRTRKTKPRTAVGYLRVSTNEQVEHGAGLDIQRDAIIAAAAERGVTIVAWYSDEGESGSNGLESRVALGEALDAIELHSADAVIVYRLDRLARDLVLQEQLLAEIWRKGGAVVSCSQSEDSLLDPDDHSDPSRTLIRQVLGAVAEYERKMIALRMHAGRRRKLAATGYAGGPRPYGWQSNGRGALLPDPDEQAVLRHIADLRSRGVSFNDIAADLTARRIPRTKGEPEWRGMEVHRTHARAVSRWRGPIPDDYRRELPRRQDQLL